jgi:hypothetical protein
MSRSRFTNAEDTPRLLWLASEESLAPGAERLYKLLYLAAEHPA